MAGSAPSNTLPDGTQIGRTALRVSDGAAMSTFYQEVVGLQLLDRGESSITLGVDGRPLLVLEEDETAPARRQTGTGLYHNAFRVPSRGALGDALRRIHERSQLDGASDHYVSEALYCRDPDGNGVEIYADYPRENWPHRDDGTVQIGTEPLELSRLEAAANGDSRLPAGSDLGHVHLEVSSLETFREFYVETLGFDVQTTLPSVTFVSAGGYHHHIGANTWHDRSTPAAGRGLSWFEIVVPERRVTREIRERTRERGYAITEKEGGFEISDPDGIRVRFREPIARRRSE